MKFAHLLTLLLALWAPFNAVTAGAYLVDCPMHDLSSSQSAPCPAHAETQAADDAAGGCGDCSKDMGGCDHCAHCMLTHGGVYVPTTFNPAIVPLPQPAPDTRVANQASPGIPDSPFRPPLTA